MLDYTRAEGQAYKLCCNTQKRSVEMEMLPFMASVRLGILIDLLSAIELLVARSYAIPNLISSLFDTNPWRPQMKEASRARGFPQCEDAGAWLEPWAGASTALQDSYKIGSHIQIGHYGPQSWDYSYITRAIIENGTCDSGSEGRYSLTR